MTPPRCVALSECGPLQLVKQEQEQIKAEVGDLRGEYRWLRNLLVATAFGSLGSLIAGLINLAR